MEGSRITNILILKMAIANLLVTISVMPFSVLVHNVGSRSIGGLFWRNFSQIRLLALYQMSAPASIFIVIVVSNDRFVAIIYPMKLRVLPKTKMTTFSMSVSSAPYAIPFMISLEIYERDLIYDYLRCFPPLNYKTSFQIYYLITFLFLYCAPLLILRVV